MLHRDVKPSNILLDGECRAWLADTGMAKAAAENQELASKLTTTTVRGTPGFVDPLITNGLQHSPLTDGFAMGITILVALVALPAVGLHERCRLMLTHPHAPERWQSTGEPVAIDGEWPAHVVSCVLEAVAGLTRQYAADRLPLGDVLRDFEAMALEAAEGEGEVGGKGEAAATAHERRLCVVCEARPRTVSVRLGSVAHSQ